MNERRSSHTHSSQSEGSTTSGLAVTLWVIAALLAEIDIACWFFGRLYSG